MKRPIRVHFFLRPYREGATYSIERAFDAMIAALPRDRFVVRRLICPVANEGLVKRLMLIIWAAFRQGDVNHITGDVYFLDLLMSRKRTVVTYHDAVSARRLRGLRQWIFRLFWLELPVSRAGVVTAISDFSRQEIEYFAPRAKGRIRVVPNCLTVAVGSDRRDFNEARPRILFVGTTPNKNLARTVEALSGMICTLAIVGPLSPDQRSLLDRARISYEPFADLDDDQLNAEYKRADMLLFASTYEGFGLPILEAQALGCLVVTSDLEPMRSVAGSGALLVDPADTMAMRAAVDRLRVDASLRASLRDKGKRNVERFLPAAVAAQYAAIYDELAAPDRAGS